MIEKFLFLILVLTFIGGVAMAFWYNRPTPHYGKDSVEPTTCELLQKVLHTIGCTSRDKEIKKGLKRVSFPYRGGNFIAYTWEDCVYVHLWNTYWTDVSMDSLDEVCAISK